MKIDQEPGVIRIVQETLEKFVDGCGPLPEDLEDRELTELASVQQDYQKARRWVRRDPEDRQAIRALTAAASELMDIVRIVLDRREVEVWHSGS